MKKRWLSLLLLSLAACDPGHGATDDDVAADAAMAEVADDVPAAEDVAATDVWPDGFWAPTTITQLYGLWVNDDGATVRAFQLGQFDVFDTDMADVSPYYELFRYAKGTAPTLVERGRATLGMGPTLRLEVVWSETVTDKGKKTELTMLAAPQGSFSLATGGGTPRVYAVAGKLP